MRFPSSTSSAGVGLLALSCSFAAVSGVVHSPVAAREVSDVSSSPTSPTNDAAIHLPLEATETKELLRKKRLVYPPSDPPVTIQSLSLPAETSEELEQPVNELNNFFRQVGGVMVGQACTPSDDGERESISCAGEEVVFCSSESWSWEHKRGCPGGFICTTWVGQDFVSDGWTVMFGCEEL